jgi:hypothetical protein
MELVALLRALWRRRIIVLAGILVAVGAGYLATQGATSRRGVASLRVIVDTPKSQIVEIAPEGADTLAWRASLLGDLMASDTLREAIARRMSVPPGDLAVTAPYLSVPEVPNPLARRALDAAAAPAQPYHVAIQSAAFLPIIGIDAEAPTRAQAAKLAKTAGLVLEGLAAQAASDKDLRQLEVREVGPVRSREVLNGSRKFMAAAAGAIVFGLWCAIVTVIDGVSRRRRHPTDLLLMPDPEFLRLHPLDSFDEDSIVPESPWPVEAIEGSHRREREIAVPGPREVVVTMSPSSLAWDRAPDVLPSVGIDSRRANRARSDAGSGERPRSGRRRL